MALRTTARGAQGAVRPTLARADARSEARTGRPRSAVAVLLFFALAAGLVHGALGRLATAQRRDDPPLADRSEGRSVVVFPLQRIALRMDHAHPAHRDLPCTDCHAAAPASTSSGDLLLPEERACAGSACHADRVDRDVQTVETCGYCHAGFDPSGSTDPGDGPPLPSPVVPDSSMPAPHLVFSHATHVAEGMTCERCHEGVRDARLATRAHLPTMRDCMDCHAPPGLGDASHPAPTAPATCETCHVAEPDGTLVTTFREGTLLPPRWMAGMHHDHEWLTRHRWIAADSGPLCAECHTEDDCADCHDGRVRPLRVHPGDFLTTHSVMARRDAGDCTSCHAPAQFCTECHARLGLSRIAAPDVRTPARHHPPRAVWIEGPNLHGREARRALETCTSCHAEADCVDCHGAAGVGGGVSPHPPGFPGCRAALETNARACVTCHGDELERLASRCL